MHIQRLEKVVIVFLAAFSITMAAFDSAYAQWVPPRGEGSLSLEYQHFNNFDHIFSDISNARWQVPEDNHDATEVSGNVMALSLDYAVYDRLALNVLVPFVNTSLESDNAHAGDHSVDNAANYSFQDLGLNLRYLVLSDPLFVTTSVGLIMPMHNYGTHGHAAIGRNLNVLSVGLGAARMLNPILPGVYLQGSYSYSFTEEVFGFNMNRSNASVGLTYFPSIRPLALRAFSVSAYWNQQITHGGVDWSDPGINTTHPEWFAVHDRIAAENFGQIGGAISFSVTDQLGLYMGYFKTVEVASQNTQRLKGFNFGTTTSF